MISGLIRSLTPEEFSVRFASRNLEFVERLIEHLNRLLTLLANFGVLVGIGFLIYEVRLNTQTLQAQAYQSRAEASFQNQAALADSEFMAPLLAKASELGGFPTATLDDFSYEERVRLRSYGQSMRIVLDNQFYQYEQGFLGEDYFQAGIKSSMTRMAPFWATVGGVPLRPSFEGAILRFSAEQND